METNTPRRQRLKMILSPHCFTNLYVWDERRMIRFKSLQLYSIVLLSLLGLSAPNSASTECLPFELSRDDDVALLAAGGLLGMAAISIQSDMPGISAEELSRLDPGSVNRFDRSATRQWSQRANTASNWLERSLMPLPVMLAVTDAGQNEPTTILTMYGETLLLTNATVQLIKGTVRRTRPYAYNSNPDISARLKQSKKTRRSFPSGHAANTFATAVFTGSMFEKMYPSSDYRAIVWGSVLTAAATTGYCRYAAGRHYPTDIIIGAAIGAAIGYLVPKVHEVNENERGASNTVPLLTFRFTF
jgi:PAP2 superfamily